MRFRFAFVLMGSALAVVGLGQITPARMPRTPDIHGDKIVFSAEGDLWLADLSEGNAERITTDEGVETNPRFSPDGSWIAFTGQYDGGNDVYVMPAAGGAPRRVTYDPTGAEMVSWTPDGKSILFRSHRNSAFGLRLFLVPVAGGLPVPLPMEKAAQGSFSPDGGKLAYVRLPLEEHHWKRYHGGEANAVWIYNRAAKKFGRIDSDTVNEQYPVWVGKDIFYVSERDGTANLWRFDTETGAQKRVTSRSAYDVVSPASDGRSLIYVWGNELWVYNIATGSEKQVKLNLISDMIHARPHTLPGTLAGFSIGPTGKRVAVLGRGQIFTAPAESGDIREISNQLGTKSKDPAWSPDGKSIAFVSDRDGEENLWIAPGAGDGPAVELTHEAKIPLDGPVWSPDSKLIAYRDFSNALNLVDVAAKTKTKIDQADYDSISDYRFSPDSKWIAYSKQEDGFTRSLFLYNIEKKTSTKISRSPMRDSSPVFDPEGKYLYFMSERNVVAKSDAIDFQMDFAETTKLYALPLASDTPSPLPLTNDEEPGSMPQTPKPEAKPDAKTDAKPAAGAPAGTKSDEESADEADDEDTPKPVPDVKIDFDGIAGRAVELPVAPGDFLALQAMPGKVLYLLGDADNTPDLHCYTFKTKKDATLADNVSGFAISADGKKMALRGPEGIQIADAGDNVSAGEGKVDLSGWQVRVDPVAEWHEIFEQAWRQHRDIFYDPQLHGMNWDGVRQKYEALLPSVGARSELNEIIGQMQGEMNVSHEFVGGGAPYPAPGPQPGVASLGVILQFDPVAKAFKLAHLYEGDGFDADTRSPLLGPGLGVKEGDYLLSINGTALTETVDPNALLVGQAGHVVRLDVNSKPVAAGAKVIRVKAMPSDADARYADWVRWNRDYVDKQGGGDIGYVHVPDMETQGMQEFSKYFYANLHKDGLILDVRNNSGGDTSCMILERLKRVIFEYDQPRYGAPNPYHPMGYIGHVVVLCNENTSSDGEYFCTGFRYMGIGKTVGTRTWGGFMAVSGFPALDGGFVTTPVEGSFTPDGKWLPDGTGFTPDYIVDEDPNAFVAGRDPQIDKAVELLKAEIKADPPKWPKRLTPPSAEKAFKPNKG